MSRADKSNTSSLRVSDATTERFRRLKEKHSLKSMDDVAAFLLKTYEDNNTPEEPSKKKLDFSDEKAEAETAGANAPSRAPISYDDLKEDEDAMSWITGLKSRARDWLWPELSKAVSSLLIRAPSVFAYMAHSMDM